VATWVVVIVAAAGAFAAWGDSLQASDSFVGHPESKRAQELIAQRIPGADSDIEVVIVRSPGLTVRDAAFKAHVDDLARRIEALGPQDIASVTTSYQAAEAARQLQDAAASGAAAGGSGSAALAQLASVAAAGAAAKAAAQAEAMVSADGHTALIPVTLTVPSTEASGHLLPLYDLVTGADGKDGFTVVMAGSATWEHEATVASGSDLARGEAIGVPIALLILIVVFSAVVAALVPLALGVVAIVVGAALTALLGQAFTVSIFALNIVAMMGLAVGIDYSLFIVSRYREERAAGRGISDAVCRAAATASRAVLFSGLTVVLALCGMLVVPFSVFTSLGAGAIVVVIAAVAAAMTLLPAVLVLLGDRVDALRLPLGRSVRRRKAAPPAGPDAAAAGQGFWGRTAGAIMRRPALSLLLGAAALLALAAPGLAMQRGQSLAAGLPADLSSPRAAELLTSQFSAGLASPVQVAIDGRLSDPRVGAAIERLTAAAIADGRFMVGGYRAAPNGDLGLLELSLDEEATSEKAAAAVRDLRATIIPGAVAGAPAEVLVGGLSASVVDVVALVDRYTPIVIAAVLLLSCILLLVAFRSLVIAVTAVFMNLLSVGAAYGLLTLVFQNGIGSRLFGFARVEAIESWVPLLLFCVLFGLSMDYQVFLISRIRERYDRRGETRDAVTFGIQSTAGIITGAAVIMVAVFAALASGSLVMLQEIGFGLAAAVALDATLVRVVVVPSTMALLGRWNWYLPRWLEWLPQVTVEEGAAESSGPVPAAAPGPAMAAARCIPPGASRRTVPSRKS
jgi:RND superfamily putative drug exporter